MNFIRLKNVMISLPLPPNIRKHLCTSAFQEVEEDFSLPLCFHFLKIKIPLMVVRDAFHKGKGCLVRDLLIGLYYI